MWNPFHIRNETIKKTRRNCMRGWQQMSEASIERMFSWDLSYSKEDDEMKVLHSMPRCSLFIPWNATKRRMIEKMVTYLWLLALSVISILYCRMQSLRLLRNPWPVSLWQRCICRAWTTDPRALRMPSSCNGAKKNERETENRAEKKNWMNLSAFG